MTKEVRYMEGLLRLALQIFLFIMLVTSWRELLRVGVAVIKMVSEHVTKWLTNIGK